MGEVEDTVVDMAEQGQFQGMSAQDAMSLVAQELESMYSPQGMSEASKEKTPGVALSKAYQKDFDGIKPVNRRPETALTGTYSKTGKPGGELKKRSVAESYPKHQDLSGISTEKLKAYLAKQSQQQVSGEGNQVKRVRAELQRRSQGVSEGRATYGPITDQHKAASKKAFDAGVRDGKAGAEKNKEYMSSELMKTTYLNGYKQGRQGVSESYDLDAFPGIKFVDPTTGKMGSFYYWSSMEGKNAALSMITNKQLVAAHDNGTPMTWDEYKQALDAGYQGVAEGAKEDMSKEVKAMATGTCPHCHGPVKKKEHPTLTQYHCAKCGIRASQDKPGVAEGNDDDVWGPQGRFAGDVPVNVGGAVSKRLDVGDVVSYFGEKATILAMSKDRTVSRIDLKSGITQNVKTSDLKRVGQGVSEGVDPATYPARAQEAHEKYLKYENMVDQELRKLGQRLPQSWDAARMHQKLSSDAKYALALKYYDLSEKFASLSIRYEELAKKRGMTESLLDEFVEGLDGDLNEQGMAESIPDVDHMHGGRGINLSVADNRDLLDKKWEIYGDYKQWSRDVDRVNSELLDDNADYTTTAGGEVVSINNKRFAAWSNRNGNGDLDIALAKKYSQQGMAEDATKKLSGATPAPAPNPYLKDILIRHIDEVRHFVQTGYFDPTKPLFEELYEYFANEIPESVRRNPARLERRIGDLVAPYAKFYAGTQNMNEQGIAEDEFDQYENGVMDEQEAVAAMFTRLARRGRDPIDIIANRFGWGTHELDDLAQANGFADSAEWLNSFEPGLAEASGCNHTREGEMCPEHGLVECGMHESQVAESQEGDALLARIKSLALLR
jgi:hypothetical protein